jgi:hypothetical protein
MANQHPNLERKGQFWHYKLQVNGRRAHGSTRATDLATAKKILEERRRELLEGQLTTKQPKAITLAVLLQEWLTCHKPTHSEKHCRGVESITRIWLIPKIGQKPMVFPQPWDQLKSSGLC